MILFRKKKNHSSIKQTLIKIIEKLEKSNIGDYEVLEDIKLELQENIPLSDKKLEYLKKMISELKNKRNTNFNV